MIGKLFETIGRLFGHVTNLGSYEGNEVAGFFVFSQ